MRIVLPDLLENMGQTLIFLVDVSPFDMLLPYGLLSHPGSISCLAD